MTDDVMQQTDAVMQEIAEISRVYGHSRSSVITEMYVLVNGREGGLARNLKFLLEVNTSLLVADGL